MSYAKDLMTASADSHPLSDDATGLLIKLTSLPAFCWRVGRLAHAVFEVLAKVPMYTPPAHVLTDAPPAAPDAGYAFPESDDETYSDPDG